MGKSQVTSYSFSSSEKIAILRSPEVFSWPGEPHLRNSQNFVFFEIFFWGMWHMFYMWFLKLFSNLKFFSQNFHFLTPLGPKNSQNTPNSTRNASRSHLLIKFWAYAFFFIKPLGVGNLEKIHLSPHIYIMGFMGDTVVGSDKNLLNKKRFGEIEKL